MVSSGWVGGISSWFKNTVDKKGTIIHTSLYIHISTHMKQSVSMCGEVQSSVTITLQPRAHCAVEYWSKETVCVGTTARQGDWRQDTALLPRADFCQSQQTEILLLLLWSLVEPQECVLASLPCWNPADKSFDLLPWRLLHPSHECWVQGSWSDFLRSGSVLSVALPAQVHIFSACLCCQISLACSSIQVRGNSPSQMNTTVLPWPTPPQHPSRSACLGALSLLTPLEMNKTTIVWDVLFIP